MNLILLIASLFCTLLTLLIFGKKNKNISDYILGVWLLITTSEFIIEYLIRNEQYYQYPHITGVLNLFPFLHAPLLFLYVLSIVKSHLRASHLILSFLPFLIMSFLNLPFFMLEGDKKVELYLKTINSQSEINSLQFMFGLLLYAIVGSYLVAGYINLNRYLKKWLPSIVFPKNNGLVWLRNLIFGYMVIWISVFLTGIIFQMTGFAFTLHSLGLVIFAMFMISIGYLGLQRTGLFSDLEWNGSILSKNEISDQFPYQNWKIFKRYAKSGLKEDQASKYLHKLKNFMTVEKPFLNSKLSLGELAESIKISQNHLSQIINEKLEQNFSDFVNSYRIEEFKLKVNQPESQKYTLLGLAYDCGFNSKSSFNTVFKKLTGLTPSQYLSSQGVIEGGPENQLLLKKKEV